jgi:TetR/AcrR family transcriptional regulator
VEEIMAVVGELFGQEGYDAVTMARVARGVGLRQASLYYYFANREELFAGFVDRSYVAPLRLAGQVLAEVGSPGEHLFRFVEADVTFLCGLPFAVADVHRIAVRDRNAFASYWSGRGALEGRVAKILRAGIGAGQLRRVPVDRTAQMTLLRDDAAQTWYLQEKAVNPGRLAAEVAEMTLRGLLVEVADLDELRRTEGAGGRGR